MLRISVKDAAAGLPCGISTAAWFETRGVAALLTMRIGRPHPEEPAAGGRLEG
jgi:hypothetical protein